jgi:TrmH family RNA methyltransferase
LPVRNVTSSTNPEIRRVKALRDRRDARHAERLFIVEGPRFVRDATTVSVPELLIISESAYDDWHASRDLEGNTIVVPDSLFATLIDTETPQGVLGVFPLPDLEPLRPAPHLTVVADGIQDPGNLGTIVRSAAATGASQVLCTPGTVDPYNPKVVRAAAGAHFLVPVRFTVDLAAALSGSAIYLAAGGTGRPIDQVDWTVPSSVVIGSEAHGPSADARRLKAATVSIPMVNSVESLNAGVAASIILYEAFRQRRHRE